VNVRTWQKVSTAWLLQMQQAETADAPPLAALASQLSNRLLLEAILAGGLGLMAVVVSVLLMLWFGRRLARELASLHDSARRVAEDRLPSVVERLRNGDEVDVAADTPPPGTGKITEIAQVAEAFAKVQRTAVEAAIGQADLRKGVNQVFLNLSLRNQSLLHRQLGLLDTMERAASDPAALDDLFRLDHLTTRMRRHAESLIILSGSTPGRGWRDPVAAVDVLRAAIAEIEDYVRVDVVSESRDAIVGPAVNDVIHLIAELVENATAFSPPNTQVEVKADAVGSGFAVEIEDRGLGLAADEMAEFNERLASPPEFDLASTDQLGLFVVGHLAARHGIRVSLHGSPYGGTRAIVLIPLAIIARDAEASEPPVAGSGGRRAMPGSGTEPIPAQAAGADASRRASVLTLTGRHRLASESPDGQAFAGLGRPAAREVPARQRRAASPNRASPPPAGSHPAGRQQQPRPPEAAGLAGDRQADAGTHLGMPRRVRQASLAPQLRAGGPGGPSAASPPPGSRQERTPEEARSLMAALQAGWEHGRTDDLGDPGGGLGAAAGIETDSSDGEAT
jgi:signal transduction histidine kinase